MNKPAIPSKSLLQGKPYIPAHTHSNPAPFAERMRTADHFPRQSDGRDGDTEQPEDDRRA